MLRKEYGCSLLHYNTFGIDAKATCMMTYDDEVSLQEALCAAREEFPGRQMLHIGGGSNLLFLSDFDGVILHSAIKGIEVKSDTGESVLLRVGAGTVWDELVAYCVSAGYYGLENLSLIPGEVGASAVQNIGAYGAEAKDVIESIEGVSLVDGSLRVFQNSECGYGYRQSRFKTDWKGQYAITYVWFRLSHRFVPNIEYGGIRRALDECGVNAAGQVTANDVRHAVIAIRKQKLPDPAEWGNAGSFFMNPVVSRAVYERLAASYEGMPYYEVSSDRIKIPAGWLIEQCGWKGRSLGRAAVHDRQALVLINKGGATGADILNLCNAIRADVKSRFDIEIYPEVNFIGHL